ncbi:MAG: DUF1778 domain-containing protein [Alphaproteobacteria bacterium]|nr:DUF1778 domain-containing protein [Alphaproteobacteria bacterium]
MVSRKAENAVARIEARVPAHVYDTMQRAASILGMTLTGYLLATAGENARRIVEEADILRLTAEDQRLFAEALINPTKPNAKLIRAAKRHADLIIPR